jgi:predicted heme/steroid binding protein
VKKILRRDLAQFDGSKGKKAYVAFEGTVYDVTESYLWERGEHQSLHMAGQDLTEELLDAPHDEEELKQFPVVGTLED